MEDGGTAMIWFFVVVKGDFSITIEAEEEVVVNVVWGDFSKSFLSENSIRRTVKFIQVGHELVKLFPILLKRLYKIIKLRDNFE